MSELIAATEDFVLHLFKEKLDYTFLYHNYTHTNRVYRSINEIIEHTELSEEDILILKISALLHDTGYTVSTVEHETESVKIATSFLQSQQVTPERIERIAACIMATKFNTKPNNMLGELIRDADSSHFGKKYFLETSEFLRHEYKLQKLHNYSASEWRDINIKVLIEQHQFYSKYALETWQPKKEKHLAALLIEKKNDKKKLAVEKLKAKLKNEAKGDEPERGIQTFYRVALKNHIKLSDIADTKANILLSVNAIIISVVLANLLSKLDKNPFLVLPTAVFIVSSTITMILAVIATRPNVTSGQFTREDVKNKKVNLTFFGNFHKMKLSEFQWAIEELIKDKDYLYSSFTKDLYFLGKVLNRKYTILRITYTIFVIGIIVSILAFTISFNYSEIPTDVIVS
jgi:predicted metal-dependent HD superfamily phosphohydrolase